MAQILRENIAKIDKCLVICQNFPYRIFLLSMANVATATVSSILINFISSKLSLVKNLHHMVCYSVFNLN